mgnify:CR=1 FL=1
MATYIIPAFFVVQTNEDDATATNLRSSATPAVAQERRIDTEDGFAIARADLQLRGMGDLFGERQSGVPTFRPTVYVRACGSV